MTAPTHLLQLILSCRKITAQVTCPATRAVVAMASSGEPDFAKQYRAAQNRLPRAPFYWDMNTSSRIGEKLAARAIEIGVTRVGINVGDETSRPIYYRKVLRPFFVAVEKGGVIVDGAEELIFLG